MAHDARVESAIAHWAPRFVSNGVLLQDFQEVTAGLERWDDWCRAWSARAAVHEALGHEALATGHRLTAGEHMTRSGVYYHFAKFMFVHDIAQMRAARARPWRAGRWPCRTCSRRASGSRFHIRAAVSPAFCAVRRAWPGRRS